MILFFPFNETAPARIVMGDQAGGAPMSEDQSRDEWWMAEVAKGQREALEPLIRRFATPLLTFLERMTGDRHRAEELFQEVFFAVWKNRGQYQYPRPFKSWLFAIALNQCRVAFRQRAPLTEPLVAEQVPALPGASPAEAAIATETATLVSQAVATLPTQQRSVVALRVWQQLSYAEIADIVGTTEGTVRSHMHHALLALRKYLEPRLG